jgi:hypothetical protein
MAGLRSEKRTTSKSIIADGSRRILQNVVLRVRRVKVTVDMKNTHTLHRVKVDSGHEEHTHLTSR